MQLGILLDKRRYGEEHFSGSPKPKFSSPDRSLREDIEEWKQQAEVEVINQIL